MRGFAKIAAAIAVFLCCSTSFTNQPAMAQSADQALDDAGLKTMLDGMGYETKALSKGFLITYKRDTWSLYVQIVISPDGTKLGLNANLGDVADLSTVPAKKWLDLLVSNGKIDPAVFYVDETNKKLYLHRVLDNRGVTPAILRVQFEKFIGNITDTSDVWDLTTP
ncbi:MAG TPA: hypothetical protein VGO52_02440 [Hyphomonadaceae bacterium]|jgi:hypothetical protein|nr:hypothetical protein [Hyphomonadaceae bacterium]